MLRRRGLPILTLMLVLAVALAGCGGTAPAPTAAPKVQLDKPAIVKWGSGSQGSTSYVMVEAMASSMSKFMKDGTFKNSSVSTQGAAENLVLLQSKDLNVIQSTSSDMFAASQGTKPFKEKIEFAQLFSYVYWPAGLMVMDKSAIKTLADLKGKRISLGPAGGAGVIMWDSVLKEHDMGDAKYVYLNWQDSASALKTGQIDASVVAFVSGGSPAAPFLELSATEKLRLLEVDPKKIEAAGKKNPGIIKGTVLKSAFPFFTQDSVQPAISGVMLAHPNLDDDIVYQIVKTLYDNEADVRKITKYLGLFTLSFAQEMLIPEYPLHPGAARFFKEKGILRSDLKVVAR